MAHASRSHLALVALLVVVAAPGCGRLPGADGQAASQGGPKGPPAPGAEAVAGGARATLLEALLCVAPEGSLQALRGLADNPAAARAEGVQVSHNGLDGESEVIEARIEPAMLLPFGGEPARVGRVVMTFDSPHEGFGALVYAEVEGQGRDAILALDLQPGDTLPFAIAPWGRLGRPPAPDAQEESFCPPMVGLKETGPGRYVLGCGWCNG